MADRFLKKIKLQIANIYKFKKPLKMDMLIFMYFFNFFKILLCNLSKLKIEE